MRDHLQEVVEKKGWARASALTKQLTQDEVVIGSCKAIQCLRSLALKVYGFKTFLRCYDSEAAFLFPLLIPVQTFQGSFVIV